MHYGQIAWFCEPNPTGFSWTEKLDLIGKGGELTSVNPYKIKLSMVVGKRDIGTVVIQRKIWLTIIYSTHKSSILFEDSLLNGLE